MRFREPFLNLLINKENIDLLFLIKYLFTNFEVFIDVPNLWTHKPIFRTGHSFTIKHDPSVKDWVLFYDIQ